MRVTLTLLYLQWRDVLDNDNTTCGLALIGKHVHVLHARFCLFRFNYAAYPYFDDPIWNRDMMYRVG